MDESKQERGQWAERYVRDFLALPLVCEFVYHSIQTIDASQKEVADFLITYPGVGVLLSQKAQKDPTSRTTEKAARWACKEAVRASSQLTGALRSANARPMWCNHPRRGRIELPDGLPSIDHGVVLVEVLQPVDMNAHAAQLPLQYSGTPITYFSLNDFLNVAAELRTVPEIAAYLNARLSLPFTELRIIGDERALFEFYLLNGGTLAGCLGRADAVLALATRRGELERALQAKWESDHYSGLMEDVAAKLSARRADYAEGLSAEALLWYDPPENRSGYLRLQAVLADMGLRERAELGRAFSDVMDQRDASSSAFVHRAIYFDSQPDWVYVMCSSNGINAADLETLKVNLMTGAMAFYRKTRAFLVIDRERKGYEVGMLGCSVPPSSPTDRALGDTLFGNLRVSHNALSIVPLER